MSDVLEQNREQERVNPLLIATDTPGITRGSVIFSFQADFALLLE